MVLIYFINFLVKNVSLFKSTFDEYAAVLLCGGRRRLEVREDARRRVPVEKCVLFLILKSTTLVPKIFKG